ncbi:MAG: ribonuclease [Rhizobiaceae bacterium]|nr:ribonuclease [Rhizobiaceae bacterium]
MRIAAGLLLACLIPGLVACEQQDQKPAAHAETAKTARSDTAAKERTKVAAGGGFDFYVLTLSWSPSYCEAEGDDANRQQCASGRPYAFVVHGLWPQFERGYPSDCRVKERDVDEATLRGLYDIMPSAGLIRHQWRKHGSCSGLSQSDYFRMLRRAREFVAIPAAFRRLDAYRTVSPDEVERAFIAANPGIEPDGIAATCDRRLLREVRICMTKGLEYRACPDVDRQSCRRDTVVMPPVRGG